jgi:hypothetical protein
LQHVVIKAVAEASSVIEDVKVKAHRDRDSIKEEYTEHFLGDEVVDMVAKQAANDKNIWGFMDAVEQALVTRRKKDRKVVVWLTKACGRTIKHWGRCLVCKFHGWRRQGSGGRNASLGVDWGCLKMPAL